MIKLANLKSNFFKSSDNRSRDKRFVVIVAVLCKHFKNTKIEQINMVSSRTIAEEELFNEKLNKTLKTFPRDKF